MTAGGRLLPELAVDVGEGSRCPDVTGVAADGSQAYMNVGRVTKSGAPVAREVRARNDMPSTGVHTLFRPYGP